MSQKRSIGTRVFACAGLAWLLAWAAAAVQAAQAPAAGAEPAAPSKEAGGWDVTRPRGETREIDFTTSEGTKMSVDISPDGRWIVFDLLAHIYRVPAAGGEAQCLTQDSGVALNYSPRYSPDGRLIAFISDRGGQNNVWIMEADGSNPRPVFDDPDMCAEEPSWTPDGEYIVVRRQGICHRGLYYGSLWMYHRDGGKGVRLVEESGASWPSVSADGKYLYFQAGACKGHFAEATQGCLRLKRMEVRGGRIEDLTGGIGDGAFAPEVSPDGRRLALARRIPDATISRKGRRLGPRAALWVRDLASGAERMVMDPIEADNAEGIRFSVHVLPRFAWARDGRTIVLSQGGRLRRLEVETGKVETIPFTARVRRTISQVAHAPFRITDGPFEARFLRWPTASPDGRRLAFHAVGRIWVQDLPEGEPRRLTPGSFGPFEFSPAWSPDGRKIAFTSWDEKERGHVWTLSAKGGEPRKVTEDSGEYLNPVWSADGARIVVSRGAGATARGRGWPDNPWYDLLSLPAAGGAAEVVARGIKPAAEGVDVVRASFGPEGQLFYPERTTEKQDGKEKPATLLVSVKPDGGDRRVHMKFRHASEATASPDGRWVAFQEGLNVYLVPLPWIGTGATTVLLDKKKGDLPVKAISLEGGLYPRWRDADALEFGSGSRYFVHRISTGRTEEARVRLRVPPRAPGGTIAFTGARILTMDRRRVIDRGTVVVKGTRIACVGECDAAGADRVVDAAGKTLIPGLIDVHAHHNQRNATVIPPRNFESAIYLAYGVITTLDPSALSAIVFTSAELIRAGLGIGPRMFSTGEALGDPVAGENPDVVEEHELDTMVTNEITSYEIAEREVNRLAGWGAVSIKQYMNPRRAQRQWIVEAARKRGVMVTGESGSLEHELAMIMDGQPGWEHEILAIPLYGDVAKFVGQAGATYSATFSASGPGPWGDQYFYAEADLWKDEKLRRFLPTWELMSRTRRRMLRPPTDYGSALYAQAMADIIAEGGYGAVGGHGQFIGLDTHFEIWMAASALGPMGALEVATAHPARFLGADQDLGSLVPGKLADLLVLDSNPLEDIRNTADALYVMKDGVLYDASTLDEVWPRQRRFGDPYWVTPEALRSDDRPDDWWDRSR